MSRLRAAVRRAWLPRRRESPADWIRRRVRLSDLEAAKGPYDLDSRPWWAEILNAIGDPTVRTIAIPAATQVGKTLALCAAILYLADNAPASALVVVPTEADAREFRERLYRLAEESGLRIPIETKWNMRFLQIGGMRIYLAWSGARQRLRGRRCKYVFLTEIDVYDRGRGGDPVEAAKQRTKAFPRHLILMETSPVPEVSRIEELHQQPERRRLSWKFQCPHCDHWQTARFFRYTTGEFAGRGGVAGHLDADGRPLDPDSAWAAAHYVCLSGCRIEPRELAGALRDGRWVAEGCSIDDQGDVTGTPNRNRQHVGFHLWAVHSHKFLGEIAAEYATAYRDGGIPDWFGNWFGRSYQSRGQLPTWRQIGERFAAAYYRRGQVPPGCWFLTAGCDVQEREVYCVVRGWGDQQASWLIDWFVFERAEGDESEVIKSDICQLAQVLETRYPVIGPDGQPAENPRGRHALQVALMGIDANYRTLDVHEWIRAMGKPIRIRAVRGDPRLDPQLRYRKSTIRESRREREDGTGPVVYQGGLDLWGISTDPFRLWLVDRFRGSPDRRGAWLLPSNVLEAGQHYLKQLVNEPPRYIRGKDGRMKVIFEEVDSFLGHDYWDCEVYGTALGQMVVDQLKGNPGWDANRWEGAEMRAGGTVEATGPAKPARLPSDRAARSTPPDRSAR
jgi:phage terminase large subunit GpA-like protein